MKAVADVVGVARQYAARVPSPVVVEGDYFYVACPASAIRPAASRTPAPDGGSDIRVDFPLADHRPAPAPAPASTSAAGPVRLDHRRSSVHR
jgi:hypothetical protein